MEYVVPEVTAELIIDIAKTLASSASPMTKKKIQACYEGQYSNEYVRRALIATQQLGLSEPVNDAYKISETERDDIKRATKSELYIKFRKALQDYAPFLLYIDFASKGFEPLEAAMRTRGIFEIKTTAEKIDQILRGWGVYAKLIEYDAQTGNIQIKVSTDKLLASYVEKLLASLEAELRAKLFTIDLLGSEVFAYLDSKSLSLNELASALRNYESEPKSSASKACETFEAFLHAIGVDKGINMASTSGVIEKANSIRQQKLIPANQVLLCNGIGGIRNMTHHNPDAEIGKPWTISQQASLTTILLVPIAIRSLYLSIMQQKYEL